MDVINLTGVELPVTRLNPGDLLPFTLHWQSDTPITVDLTTFAHLLNSEGQVAAQLDWGPQDSLGYLPTTAWRPDYPVIDSQALSLPPDLPPGNYTLVVGWYYPPSGERLPITSSDQPALSGNLMPVGTVTVQP